MLSTEKELQYTIQRVCPTKKKGPLKASVYVCFGPMTVIAKVLMGENGLFVGWPAGQSHRGGRTQYWPWVKFPCDDFRQELEHAVILAYEER